MGVISVVAGTLIAFIALILYSQRHDTKHCRYCGKSGMEVALRKIPIGSGAKDFICGRCSELSFTDL